MRPRILAIMALSLALAVGGTAAAQEDGPTPTATAEPVLSESGLEAQPPPVAYYWREWALHKGAARQRLRRAVENAERARAGKKAYYRALVGVHDDELHWLSVHQPEECYLDEYEAWRAATEDLRAVARKSVRQGVKRTRKPRRAAIRQLDKAFENFAECTDSLPDAAESEGAVNPFAGSWRSIDDFVEPGGFRDRNRTSLTIDADGAFLNRDPKNLACRRAGFGYVPVTWKGTGEFVADDVPVFAATGRVHCYPRGVRKLALEEARGEFRYDAEADVVLRDDLALCYWRTEGGSPQDCSAYWRGAPLSSVDPSSSPGQDTPSEEEGAAASPGTG